MIDTIYIEEEIANHARVQKICQRFSKARIVRCERYGEVFNRNSQNFRLQKHNPALILAKKFQQFVLETPEGYGIGGSKNYYFSHMLNCIYDCRYCFLQGMYRSANYLLFINYEDFLEQIEKIIQINPDETTYFFSGYDCDSLALDNITFFTHHFVPRFAKYKNARLELRTKSIHIKPLLQMPGTNCIVAFSFTPQEISTEIEHKVPSVISRIGAMVTLQQNGWTIGIRFDPLIYHQDYQKNYQNLFKQIFSVLDKEKIHSVSLGHFRLPKNMFQTINKLYPKEKLFYGPVVEKSNIVSYQENVASEMSDFCKEELLKYVDEDIFFPCY